MSRTMRAPDFWRHDGLTARLLQPAAALYAALGRRRRRRTMPHKAAVPVVCVGNLVAGGAGKTPAALAVAAGLSELGRRPAFLSRGYGGRLAGPVVVVPGRHGFREVGDEPLLLAAAAPTVVARDRPAGAALAEAEGADVLVLDDGFQNPSLAKDLSLLVVDAAYGLGNGRVHPAGPLREPAAEGLARADAVVRVAGLSGAGPRPAWLGPSLPLLETRLVPDEAAAARLHGRRVLAFAGIGRPEKFFRMLRDLGADLVDGRGFADHHPYTPDEVMRLADAAAAAEATLVTTAKDAVRLPAAARPMVQVIGVRLAFDDPERLLDLLRQALAGHG